jgi:hypothetical protein
VGSREDAAVFFGDLAMPEIWRESGGKKRGEERIVYGSLPPRPGDVPGETVYLRGCSYIGKKYMGTVAGLATPTKQGRNKSATGGMS